MSKRSTTSLLARGAVLGVSAFALAACEEDRTETVVLERDWDCTAQTSALADDLSPEQCASLKEAAETEHLQTAPRYESRALCEEEHGADACEVDPVAAEAGTNAFMPFLAGYMLGSTLNNGQQGYAARSLVSNGSGRLATTDGAIRLQGTSGRTQVSTRAFTTKPAVTAGKPPMTRATVSTRGGFGASRTATGARGFGG